MSKKLNLLNPGKGSVNKGVTYAKVNDDTTSATLDAQYKAEYVENTLAGELQRIKAYIAEIGREAAFLALKAAGANVDQNSKLEIPNCRRQPFQNCTIQNRRRSREQFKIQNSKFKIAAGNHFKIVQFKIAGVAENNSKLKIQNS